MKIVKCNNCNSNKNYFLLTGKDRLYRVDQKKFTYVKCVDCGLVFLNPQPNETDLKRYYPDEYGPYQDNNAVFKYGPISKLFRKIKPHKKTVNKCIIDNSQINYLDFGCGGGEFLVQIRKDHPNWNLYGIDNNEYACRKVKEKRFNVFCGDITNMDVPANFFDIVNMSHVIEHLTDPRDTILKIRSKLKNSSRIVISTPNFDSLAAKIFKTYWYALEAPRHLYLYTPGTIKFLLEKNGFEVEKIMFDKGPKVGIRSMYYFLGRKDLLINPFIWRLFKPISYLLGNFGRTSIMTVYAKKTCSV